MSQSYDFMGRKFTVKPPTLALENMWMEFAINEDGSFNKNCIRDISRNAEAVNAFMRRILEGDHDGIDWYEDAPSEMFGQVFTDFFTRWSEKTVKAIDTLSAGSEEGPSSNSQAAKRRPKKTV